MHDIIIQWVW